LKQSQKMLVPIIEDVNIGAVIVLNVMSNCILYYLRLSKIRLCAVVLLFRVMTSYVMSTTNNNNVRLMLMIMLWWMHT